MPGILMALDFSKAFDSLEWSFLFKTLEKFNFGPSIIKWIKTMYNGASSAVINNGFTSQYFELKRGMRQGDPLSGYLFIICVEILAIMIRCDENIAGIKIGDNEVKLAQYADDINGLVEDEASAKLFLLTVERFGVISGLNLNREKCEAMWIGSKRNSTEKPLDISWPRDAIRVLGIYVTYNEELLIKFGG